MKRSAVMGLMDKLIAAFCAQKAVESVDWDEMLSTSVRTGKATYYGLRKFYYKIEDFSDKLLDELFLREPDFIDGSISTDCREYFHINTDQYLYKNRLIHGTANFTLSINNRFLYPDFIDEIDANNLRDYDLIDFSNRRFDPIANPNAHSITIGDYTIYYDHPFYYNVTLMLLIRADKQKEFSSSIESRAINLPFVKITPDIINDFDICTDIKSNNGVKLNNAFYAVLSDFNTEVSIDRYKGSIVLRIVDGRKTVSDNYTPCAIVDLLEQPISRNNQFVWPSIVPNIINKTSSQYILGTQFIFLDKADDVIIRGDPDTCELYVCRTNDGWGGIRFKLQNKKDYYSAAVWLIPAMAMYYRNVTGADYLEIINKYWPTYSNDINYN